MGIRHDFKLFKKSKTHLLEPTSCLGDKGYQGIQKIHKESKTPHKKPRKSQLSKEQKTAKSSISFFKNYHRTHLSPPKNLQNFIRTIS